jgi:hypothetical protein
MIARAQRFPICAVIRYRLIGENRWYAGNVVNMSFTGVLFRGEQAVRVDSLIELAVDVLEGTAEGDGSKIVSRGKVVRISVDESTPECSMMAAVLSNSRILRG